MFGLVMAGKRSAEGLEIDAGWQYFHERPFGDDDGETVTVVDNQLL